MSPPVSSLNRILFVPNLLAHILTILSSMAIRLMIQPHLRTCSESWLIIMTVRPDVRNTCSIAPTVAASQAEVGSSSSRITEPGRFSTAAFFAFATSVLARMRATLIAALIEV